MASDATEDESLQPDEEKPFSCRMCGECCYGEGGITVDRHERLRIASYLGMTHEAFVRDCCVEKNDSFSIRCGEDGYCLFFQKGKGCKVQQVKPRRCLDWPFYEALLKDRQAWSEAMDACPGINRACSHEEFVRQGKEELDAGLA
jgi:Fe-S-cluster containining protein